MKFPRNARIFRGHLDAAPFAAVFFLLIIFLMLGNLVYTPGVSLELPMAEGLPGTDAPSVAVAVDSSGRLFYQNQLVGQEQLKVRLREAAQAAPEPLTLVVQADRAVTYKQLIDLTVVAREAGINRAWLATLSRPFEVKPK